MQGRGHDNRGGYGYGSRGRGWRGGRSSPLRGGPPFRDRGDADSAEGATEHRRGRGRALGKPVYSRLDVIDYDVQVYNDEAASSARQSPIPNRRGFGRASGYPGNGASSRGVLAGRGRGGKGPAGRGDDRRRSRSLFESAFRVYRQNNNEALPPRRENTDDDNFSVERRTSARRTSGLGGNRAIRNGADVPLSKLLSLDRPCLRPVVFIPAKLAPVLFQREEEIFEVPESKEDEDHAPTADAVACVFSNKPGPSSPSFIKSPDDDLMGVSDSEQLITIDFNSIGDLLTDAPPEGVLLSNTKPYMTNVHDTDKYEANPPTKEVQMEVQVTTEVATQNINEAEMKKADSSKIMASETGDQERCSQIEHLFGQIGVVDSGSTALISDVASAELGNDIDEATVPKVQIFKPRNQLSSGAASVQTTEYAEMSPETEPAFKLDPNPDPPTNDQNNTVSPSATSSMRPLGSQLSDDDEVVYVAPYPRSENDAMRNQMSAAVSGSLIIPSQIASPAPTAVHGQARISNVATPSGVFKNLSFSFRSLSQAATPDCAVNTTPRGRKNAKRDRQVSPHRQGRKGGFGSLGAMREERELHNEGWDTPPPVRREGSDIDWGDIGSSRPDENIERVSSELGAMQIDSDIELGAMQSFVDSMSMLGMERRQIEDLESTSSEEESHEEESNEDEDDEELSAAVRQGEQEFVDGGTIQNIDHSEVEEEEEDTSNEDASPSASFQARLEKLRSSSKDFARNGARSSRRLAALKGKNRASTDDELFGSEDDFDNNFTWSKNEDFIEEIQCMLDGNRKILGGRDRKEKILLSKANRDGDFSVMPAKKNRDKGKGLPPELRVLWEKDRVKKAENKRKRAAARLELALDPYAKHNGGKKGHKAMLRAQRLAAEALGLGLDDSDSGFERKRIQTASLDAAALVEQIRHFIANATVQMMALPPMDKDSRRRVHEIATVFGLKSISKGKGATRYTTLQKTMRMVRQVDERKIARIVQSSGKSDLARPSNAGGGRGVGAPRHKEGDEVGKEAPKIDENNIGFRMLAGMGWTEGDRIGVSGGLNAPLTAIIKNSKLGLGATR